MMNFDATKPNGVCCLVCEHEIANGNWFARIRVGNQRVAFCRPRCTEKFLDERERYAARVEEDLTRLNGS
jgi:hypothetical protein